MKNLPLKIMAAMLLVICIDITWWTAGIFVTMTNATILLVLIGEIFFIALISFIAWHRNCKNLLEFEKIEDENH